MEKVKDFFLRFRSRLFVYAVMAGIIFSSLLLFVFVDRIPFLANLRKPKTQPPQVSVPTILNGELVLPKAGQGAEKGLTQFANNNRLAVESAVLVPIFDSSQQLSGLRILGEAKNLGTQKIQGISPVVRFFDVDGKVVGQKIGELSSSFNFYGLDGGERGVYDVTVNKPPTSDRLEIVLNAVSASSSAGFEPMKIANRNIEIKTAQYQKNSENVSSDSAVSSGSATPVVPSKVEYFTVSGNVINIDANDPFSDIVIFAWVRGKDGKILSFNRQDFRNDLLSPSEKVDFKITLLPIREGTEYENYEIVAWGKRYHLNLNQ